MKKLNWFCLCLIIVLSLCSLTACGNNNVEETEEQMKAKVDAAMMAVNLPVNVTENLTLPATSGDIAVTWTSDKPTVISNTGIITRPVFGETDAEVKLTGSFSYKDHSDTKVFTLSVNAIKEKVFTFANGHTGDNAIFSAPNDDSYGSIVDKGDGIISLKPTEKEEVRKSGPYFRMSNQMAKWRDNGYTASVMVYLDHEAMKDGGNTFVIDMSVNDKENNWIGGIYLTFAANDTNVLIFESQSDQENIFKGMTGWYNVGIKFYENNGKLNSKSFVRDAQGTELYSWTNTKFIGFTVPETTGEHEDVTMSLVGGPRSLWFTDMNIGSVDVKQVTLSYN